MPLQKSQLLLPLFVLRRHPDPELVEGEGSLQLQLLLSLPVFKSPLLIAYTSLSAPIPYTVNT
jgi:hypothetical protein